MTCYFPMQRDVEDELLRILHAQNAPVQMTVLYGALADRFCLTRSERRGARGDPKGSAWEFLVRQARNNLREKGWLDCPAIGLWSLSGAGHAQAYRQDHTAPASAEQMSTAL